MSYKYSKSKGLCVEPLQRLQQERDLLDRLPVVGGRELVVVCHLGDEAAGDAVVGQVDLVGGALRLVPRAGVEAAPHVLAALVAVEEGLEPGAVKGRQAPAEAVLAGAGEAAQRLKVVLKVGKDEGEPRAVATGGDAVGLPLLLLGQGRQGGAAGEDTGGEDGLPLKDAKGQAGADGADEEEGRVLLVDDVLVEQRHAVVAHFDVGEEGEGPGVAGAEDDVLDVLGGLALGKVDGAALDAGDCAAAGDARVVEGLVAKVDVGLVAVDDGVDGRLCYRREVVGDVCRRDGRADDDDALEEESALVLCR